MAVAESEVDAVRAMCVRVHICTPDVPVAPRDASFGAIVREYVAHRRVFGRLSQAATATPRELSPDCVGAPGPD
jgi:hypothetical protein